MTGESATVHLEECKAVFPFLSLFPSVSMEPFEIAHIQDETRLANYLNDGVILFDALVDIAPNYFPSSTISREAKDNYILKQSNFRKLIRNLRIYLREEHQKQIRVPMDDLVSSIPNSQSCSGILLILELMAAAAVMSSQRAAFVGAIKKMSASDQLILKQLIQRGQAHLQDIQVADYDENTPPMNSNHTKKDTIIHKQRSYELASLPTESSALCEGAFMNRGETGSPLHDNTSPNNDPIIAEPRDDGSSYRVETRQWDPSFLNTPLNRVDDAATCGKSSVGAHWISRDLATKEEMDINVQLQMELDQMKKMNETLERDLILFKQREDELSSRLTESLAKNKAALMHVESMALAREQDLSNRYDLIIANLERDLKSYQACVSENNNYKQQLGELRDEIDILKHVNEKATQTEEHLKRMKAKLESLTDVQDCLRREEKAHSETVDKCIRLEAEIAALQPLRRQLDDYKTRLVEIEIKLAEYEQENVTLRQKQDYLSHQNAALQRGTYQQKEEELALRRQLESDTKDENDTFSSIGIGFSELNPELKVELFRLRSENERLKLFASKREDDEVQKIESRMEDLNRLTAKLKEQYLTCKVAWEDVSDQLIESRSREKQLTEELSSLHQQLDHTTTILDTTKAEHDRELDILREKYELDKLELVNAANDEKNALQDVFQNQLSTERSIWQVRLDELIREKNDGEHRFSDSLCALNIQHEKQLENLRIHHQEKLDEIFKNNEQERRSLIEKGKQMIKKHLNDHDLKVREMESKCVDIQDQCNKKLELMTKKMTDFENEARTKLISTQKAYQSCVAKHNELDVKCAELDDRCNMLQREKSELEKELDRQRRRRVGVDNGQEYLQYERYQREFQTILNENRKLKEQLCEQKRSVEDEPITMKPLQNQKPWQDMLTTSSVSLIELRSGYEETIASLNDEKRELIMKNAAAMAEAKKVRQQVWDLEETVSRLNDELTSVKLKLERVE